MIGLADVEAARRRVAAVVRATPVVPSASLSRLAGRPVLLKPEYRQRTGSFKIRGAYNFVASLDSSVTDVVAGSAGNHAQGVALAASLTGRRATVFMPTTAALPKMEATRAYGAEIRLAGDSVDDCTAAAGEHAAATGAVLVPPYDDPLVIAGQGTIGLEIVAEAPEAATVVVPVGGGGLVSGIAAALAAARPGTRVVGVEAAGAPTMRAALDAGHCVRLPAVATMADGIAVKAATELTLRHVQALVDDVVTVTEEGISAALLLLLERAKAVVEPAGAVGLAAVLDGSVGGDGAVVVVLSGGNVDPQLLMKVVDHGLSVAGRYLILRIVLPDHPGALASLTAEVARLGLNVLDVEHHRSGVALGVAEVEVMLTLETRDPAHRQEVVTALTTAGYRVELIR